MVVLFATCGLMSLSLAYLPNRLWEKIYAIYTFLIKLLRSKFPPSSLSLGQQLLELTLGIETPAVFNQLQRDVVNFPDYKFFTRVFLDLQRIKTQMGQNILIPEFRKALVLDLKFETKMKRSASEAYVQFVVTGSFTLIFMLFSRRALELPLGFFELLPILISGIGILLYHRAAHWLRHRHFQKIDQLFECLVRLAALSAGGGDCQSHIRNSQVLPLLQNKEKITGRTLFLITRLERSLELWIKMGVRPVPELFAMLPQVDSEREELYERFLKLSSLLAFLVMGIFFLLPHLFSLFFLLDGLLRD